MNQEIQVTETPATTEAKIPDRREERECRIASEGKEILVWRKT